MASSSGPLQEDEGMGHEEAEARLQAMRQAVQEQMRQINILEMDAAEHRLVLEALEPLDAGRKCFRMVGSVIVERTVADVKPALQKNLEQVSILPPVPCALVVLIEIAGLRLASPSPFRLGEPIRNYERSHIPPLHFPSHHPPSPA
eukprot:scaffold30636_cov129-Isochrysis_galbana.AAC.3